MPKALCLIGLVLAVLVFLIFLLDLVRGFSGSIGPLQSASILADILFIVCSAGLAWVAWTTFREQK